MSSDSEAASKTSPREAPVHPVQYGDWRVAAVVVAKNEEATIRGVVEDVTKHVHDVYIMDGHSTDRTREIGREAGATVHTDPGLGKGSAI